MKKIKSPPQNLKANVTVIDDKLTFTKSTIDDLKDKFLNPKILEKQANRGFLGQTFQQQNHLMMIKSSSHFLLCMMTLI